MRLQRNIRLVNKVKKYTPPLFGRFLWLGIVALQNCTICCSATTEYNYRKPKPCDDYQKQL